MIEKQQLSSPAKDDDEERREPVRHVPVPKDVSSELPDPEVAERLRSCH
jgi:hypothetical protein